MPLPRKTALVSALALAVVATSCAGGSGGENEKPAAAPAPKSGWVYDDGPVFPPIPK